MIVIVIHFLHSFKSYSYYVGYSVIVTDLILTCDVEQILHLLLANVCL